MSSSTPRPKWWLLYLTLPLLIALFVVESRMRLSSRGHIAFQIGILLLVYGLAYWWLKANTVALRKLDRDQYNGTTNVVRILVAQLPQSDGGKLSFLPQLNCGRAKRSELLDHRVNKE